MSDFSKLYSYILNKKHHEHRHFVDWNLAKEWLDKNYPTVDMLYLWADICREELLIEIEGFAV